MVLHQAVLRSSCRSRSSVSARVRRRCRWVPAGEGEEHLVEGRAGAARRRRSRCRDRRRCRTASVRRSGPSSTAIASRRVPSSIAGLVAADAARARRRAAPSESAVAGVDLDHVLAGARLELVGRAGRDDLAVVDDDDLLGELVGLVEVLRRQQHVGAGAARGRGSCPRARCGCGDRGRWSARRAAAASARRRGWRRGRACGACRPSRS